jgi:chemotaxis protein histidine kinase CheA
MDDDDDFTDEQFDAFEELANPAANQAAAQEQLRIDFEQLNELVELQQALVQINDHLPQTIAAFQNGNRTPATQALGMLIQIETMLTQNINAGLYVLDRQGAFIVQYNIRRIIHDLRTGGV